MSSDISIQIKKSLNGDEYYSPQNVVDMIVPHILRGGIRENMVSVSFKGVMK